MKDTDSSDYSSPLRRPKPLLVEKTTSNGEIVYEYNSDQEVVDAYHKDLDKYHKKLGLFASFSLLIPNPPVIFLLFLYTYMSIQLCFLSSLYMVLMHASTYPPVIFLSFLYTYMSI